MSNYKIGDKLVLEITGDGERMSVTNLNICIPNEELDKLDRLDSDYVNEHYGMLQDEAYEQGLECAWEMAKKICVSPENGGIECDDIYKLFEVDTCWKVLAQYTPQEALAKLKAYEEQKGLTRGDEVICIDTDEKAIFFGKSEGSEEGWFLMKEYDVPQRIMLNTVKKTGKHIDCLEQIGE